MKRWGRSQGRGCCNGRAHRVPDPCSRKRASIPLTKSHPGRERYPDPSTKGPEERQNDLQEEGTGQVDGREGALKLLLCTGGLAVAIPGASVNLSAGAVGIALGVLGYFLGARRLGRHVSSLALPHSSSWRPPAPASSPV
jgi:hypothetical protein